MAVYRRRKTLMEEETSFNKMRERQVTFAEDMEREHGIDKRFVLKIIQYAQCLRTPGTRGQITEDVFKSQMLQRFNMTSMLHLQIMYEAVKRHSHQPGQHLNVEDYVLTICTFYSSSLDRKIDFVYSVYDIDCNGLINEAELRLLLRSSVMSVDATEENEFDGATFDGPLKELIDIVMSVIDSNRDGSISLDEFRKYVKNDILLIEFLGQVMPPESHLRSFMATIREMSESGVKEFFRHERRKCLSEPPMLMRRNAVARYYPITLDFVDIV